MFAAGRALGHEGLQIAEELAHPGSLMFACHGDGLLALRHGDLPRALPLLERAVGICQEGGLSLFFPLTAATLGAAYALGGRMADAVPLLTQALERALAIDNRAHQPLCRLALGEVHLLMDRLEEAHALAEHTLAQARARQERGNQAYALRLLGAIAARHEPSAPELAAAHYQQALALAEELGMHPLQAHCQRDLGALYASLGQREPAHTALSAAVALYRAMAMTFWLPQTEAALVRLEERP